MRTKIIKQLFYLICCLTAGLLITLSCSDITKMHREYLDRGEQIYAGIIDSLIVRGGWEKVQIEGLSHYARSSTKCIINWDDNQVEYEMKDIDKNGVVQILFDPLPEGTYYFYVETEDEEGNRSLRKECFGSSYGEEYKSSQVKKRISLQKPDPSKMVLSWNESEKAVKVDLIFENNRGGKTELKLPGNVSQTEITDWKLGGQIKITTYTMPEENALDTIALDPVVQYFIEEVEYELDKSKFKSVLLPTDITGNGYGGKPEGIWDGVKGSGGSNRYHSTDGDGVPHHLTFDLGVYAGINKIEITGRVDFTGWNPKRLQVWGINSLDGAETTLPSNDPGWEDEAISKGWVLIVDKITHDPIENTYYVKPSIENVRYIRYRVLEVLGYQGESTGPNVQGLIQEMTLWADKIEDKNR